METENTLDRERVPQLADQRTLIERARRGTHLHTVRSMTHTSIGSTG